MTPDPISVSASTSLREWVEGYIYRSHHKVFPVMSDGKLVGYVATRDLAGLPRSEWEVRTVGEVMHSDLAPVAIAPDMDALDALKRMQRTGVSRLLVVENDRLVGILCLKDLLRFLALKLELEGETGWPEAAPAPASKELDLAR
jgi:CBS domain-containing protein